MILSYPSRRKLDEIFGEDFVPPGCRVPRFHSTSRSVDPHANDHAIRVSKKTVIPPLSCGYCPVVTPKEPSDFFGTQAVDYVFAANTIFHLPSLSGNPDPDPSANIPIEVMNVFHEPVTLKAGTVLGHSVPLGDNVVEAIWLVSALSW